jgi:hypothetical protein
MNNRREHPRISTRQDVELYLYDKSTDTQLTERVPARLSDLSKKGAGLKFTQVLIDGRHLFYTALDSETIFIGIIFRPMDDASEETPPLLARPVWLNRDMEDNIMPFRMGVQFIDEIQSAVFSRLI